LSRRRAPIRTFAAGAAAFALSQVAFQLATTHADAAFPSGADDPGRIIPAGAASALGAPDQATASLVGLAVTPSGAGYWALATNGRVFAYGDAGAFDGVSPATNRLVDIAARHQGDGYWVAASDGGVFTYGAAAFHGSMGAVALNSPVTAMAATPSGNGYWLVAADGGVFAFGDATFYGSMGGIQLNSPVAAMAATPSGNGYWLVAADGGVFAFGDAGFYGSMGGTALNSPVTAMAATPTGHGYWMIAGDGGVFSFGDAPSHGRFWADGIVADIAARPEGDGYWAVVADPLPVFLAAPSGTGWQPGEPSDAEFDRVAACESGQRWDLNTGNGYYGGLQFSVATWRALGGLGYPHQHSRDAQIQVARRQWRLSGWRAWPRCGRLVG
jgi:hypothetical protein